MRPATIVVALYALLAAIVFPVYPHFPSPNEFTRWALVASVVDGRTIEVSRAAAILGPRFEDLSVVDGRQYSNKAPGAALAAAPGYLAARPFLGPPSRHNLRPALTAMRWFGATIPLLLLALAFAAAARRYGGDEALAAGTLLFGTPLFAYGLLLFSHALCAAALFGAWMLLSFSPPRGEKVAEGRMRGPSPGAARHPLPAARGEGMRPALAGALIGLAVASEYPLVIPAVLLVAGLAVRRDWRRLALVVAGGVPFAILLGVYHTVAFGSPFATAIGFDKLPEFRQLGHTGLFGIQAPSAEILLRMLFDPARGLLLFAPILIAAAAGFRAAHRQLPRAAFVTLLLVPLATIAIYSGYPNWHGGWNVGPRYIVSAVPFLLFPIVFVERRVAALLLGMSAATVIPLTLTFPFPDRGLAFPWATLAWPLLRDGLVAPNALHLVARPLAIAVPFAIALAAIAAATGRRALFAALGVAIALGVSALVAHPTMTDRLRTGYVEEVYFERARAMAKAVPRVPPRAVARAESDLTIPPDSWPF